MDTDCALAAIPGDPGSVCACVCGVAYVCVCVCGVRLMLCGVYACGLCMNFSNHCGELRMQKLISHLLRTQSLKFLPIKPGVGQYITIHVKDLFLANSFRSIHLHFSKTSPEFFLYWLWLTLV